MQKLYLDSTNTCESKNYKNSNVANLTLRSVLWPKMKLTHKRIGHVTNNTGELKRTPKSRKVIRID